MLEFAKYLKENFNDDISTAENIIKSKWDKTIQILKEAFADDYSDKNLAIYKIKTDFLNEKIAPKNIDQKFIKENLDYILNKIESLDEASIKLIFNTYEASPEKKTTGCGSPVDVVMPTSDVLDIEMESIDTTKVKKKRGRPAKNTVKEDADEMEVITTDATDEDEKVIKISVKDNMVTVNPSENTGLIQSEHEFENEDEVNEFIESLEQLFQGFTIERDETTDDMAAGQEDVSMNAEEDLTTEAEEIEVGNEEPEDAGEEPEDAGEEPEDAGEEPEDAGEEPEDADMINWEDVANFNSSEDESEEEIMGRDIGSKEYNLENLDLNKLINNIVNVDGKWYKVKSITEDKQIVGCDKDGKELIFDFNTIDQMECDINEICSLNSSEEEIMNLDSDEVDMSQSLEAEEEVPTEEIAQEEPEDAGEEPEDAGEQPEDAGEEPEDAGEENIDTDNMSMEENYNFSKAANRYLDEDMLSVPTLKPTNTGGLTSKIMNPPKKVEKVKSAPTMATKTGPQAALTAKPSAPPKSIEKVANPEKMVSKKPPSAALTSVTKSPPKKIETVKSAPKMATKTAPKGNFTANPGKPKETIEKVQAPVIPNEYK